MDELRELTTKFMRLEEMRKYKNKIRSKTMPGKKKEVYRNSGQKGGFS